MIESGLITIDHYFITRFEENDTVTIYNSRLLGMVKATDDTEPLKFKPYILTKGGIELYEVISQGAEFEDDEQYQLSYFKSLNRPFPNKKIMLFRVKGKDEFDEIDL